MGNGLANASKRPEMTEPNHRREFLESLYAEAAR